MITGTRIYRALALTLLAWGVASSATLAQTQTAGTVVRQGETLLSAPFPYARAGRLRNDVIRRALGNQTPSLRAGTTVFQMTYHYVLRSAGFSVLEYDLPMWCGDDGVHGVCVVMFNDGARVARVTEGSAYYPRKLSRLMPCNEPNVADDVTALGELPERQLNYVARRVRPDRLRLAVNLRVGDQLVDLEPIDLPRTRDDTFLLSEGAFALTIRPENGGVVAESVDPSNFGALADARNMLTKEGWVGLAR